MISYDYLTKIEDEMYYIRRHLNTYSKTKPSEVDEKVFLDEIRKHAHVIIGLCDTMEAKP
jgi:hypothetical protein